MVPRKPPPDSDLQERRELLDAAGIARTLRRMAHEIAERIPQDERPLYLVGVRTGGAYLAHRLCDDAGRRRARGSRRWARSTSRSTATTSFSGLPKPEIGPTELPDADRRPHHRAGRRRAVHRPHGARGDRRARRLRPPARGAAGGAGRSRAARAADPARLRRPGGADHGATNRCASMLARARRARPGRAAGAARRDAPFAHRHLLGIEPLAAADIDDDPRPRRALPRDRRAPDQEGADAARARRSSTCSSRPRRARARRSSSPPSGCRPTRSTSRARPRRRSRARRCSTPRATSRRCRPTWSSSATRRPAPPHMLAQQHRRRGGQRRRRRARAPDAGAARLLDHPRAQGAASTGSRSRSAATSATPASRARTSGR